MLRGSVGWNSTRLVPSTLSELHIAVFDTASHASGSVSERVYEAFMSGWSNEGKRVRARSGTSRV